MLVGFMGALEKSLPQGISCFFSRGEGGLKKFWSFMKGDRGGLTLI